MYGLHKERRVSVINVELEYCPFCGGTSLTIDYDIDEGGWYISCDNIRCNCSILQDTEEEAIRAWNRRAKDEGIQGI